MAKWRIEGADKATGEDVVRLIEADDEAQARRRAARRGLLVASATPANTSPPVVLPVESHPIEYASTNGVTGPKGVSGLGITALVLGIIACLFSLLPFCGSIPAVLLGLLGIVFGGVGWIACRGDSRKGTGFPVAGTAVSVAACAIAAFWWILLPLMSTRATSAPLGTAFPGAAGDTDSVPGGFDAPVRPGISAEGSGRGFAFEPPSGPPGTGFGAPPDRFGGMPGRPDATSTSDSTPLQPTLLGDEKRIGDAVVSIDSVAIGPASFVDMFGRPQRTREVLLQVRLTVRNAGEQEVLRYSSWRSDPYSSGNDMAHLGDGTGRAYRLFGLSPENRVDGASGPFARLDPGEAVTDVLLFEAPRAGAGPLTLRLPGTNLREKESLSFKIPETALADGPPER